MPLSERALGRWAGSYLIPGAGDFASTARALGKVEALKLIQQHYFHDSSDYRGGDIAPNDALQAIRYARSKKLTKAERKAVLGTVKFAGFVAGGVTGATVGSIVPGAGTVAGGAVGAVGLGTVVSAGAFVADHAKRKTKGLYKIARGTRGEHRQQAARALLYCQGTYPPDDPKQSAAEDALKVILDGEHDEVMALPLDACIARLADRMKSN